MISSAPGAATAPAAATVPASGAAAKERGGFGFAVSSTADFSLPVAPVIRRLHPSADEFTSTVIGSGPVSRPISPVVV